MGSKVKSAGLDGDKKVSAALKRISAKFERLANDEEKAGRSDKAKPAKQKGVGALADRFDQIKSKIKSAGLGGDKKVSAALKRISAKFERLADDDETPKLAPPKRKHSASSRFSL